ERALSQLAGGISGPIAELREQLLLHLADLEAGLDFVEEDIEFVHRDELARRLLVGKEMIERLLQQISSRMQSTGRPRVVLAGLPNAGKSTLFNTLAGRETALVSSVPGTTRDYLQVSIDRGGMTFDLIDTAGWEAARDGIEQLASALRDDQYRRAQLIIWCSAANLSPTEREEDQAYRDIVSSQKIPYLKVVTKSDRLAGLVDHLENDISLISAETGQGIDAFLDRIAETLSARPSESDMIGSTAARCRESLKHALSGIENAVDMTAQGAGDELIAMELRDILEHLGRIVGQVYTDDILDRIFSRFCIGK
ncbi:MAG: 50S ribosome-binding GTPase, partial [Planctomycetaceae bacterium]|nr:50S ribosome-binding GTPase [Planctomycetaceae bacterium]